MRRGKHMLALASYVSAHPGCLGGEAIRACGIEQRQGYFSLKCAIAAGLVRAVREAVGDRPQGQLRLWGPETSGREI